MKSLAPSTQRTGHPKCRQLMLKAMNSLSLMRRSHAAVLAVMPDPGSGDGSVNATWTVWPMRKESTLPTSRHWGRAGRTIGATRKPTTGTPARAAIAAAQAMLSREKNRRRVILWASHGLPPIVTSTRWCMLFPPTSRDGADPQRQSADEQDEAADRHDGRRRDAPKDHRDADGKQEWRVGRLNRRRGLRRCGQWLVWANHRDPSGATTRSGA